MYQAERFRDYFANKVGASKNTQNTYNSFLGRIDKLIGGLDEAIGQRGVEAVLSWGREAAEGPFQAYPSHARSVLKRYIQFTIDEQSTGDDEEMPDEPELTEPEAVGTVFRLEREMQAAVRNQLETLAPGLKAVDGGIEVSTATGRIDILAEHPDGSLVVIELKAGACPPGAMEQALGYAEALAEERGRPVRAILIAASFSDRVRAAARRTRDLDLKTYSFSLAFQAVA